MTDLSQSRACPSIRARTQLGVPAAVLTAVLLTSGCGFSRKLAFWRSGPQRPAAARNVVLPKPESAVRRAMNQQTVGAFNPESGDRRIQLLNARLKLDPQDAAARIDLAALYEYYELEELAAEHYSRALNLDVDSLAAAQGLTRIATRNPRLAPEMLPVMRSFVRRHPENVAAAANLGQVLDTLGELAEAEALYRRALQHDPQAAWLHNNLGFNLLLQGNTAAAAASLEQALAWNPRSAIARNNLGVALARQGQRDAALTVFQHAGVDRATAHNNLAVALLEQDRLDESRAELMEALAAKSFFQPALENFRIVVERDRTRQAREAAVTRRMTIPAGWMAPAPLPPPERASESEKPIERIP